MSEAQAVAYELLALIQKAQRSGLRLMVALETPHGRVAGELTERSFLGAQP